MVTFLLIPGHGSPSSCCATIGGRLLSVGAATKFTWRFRPNV
jgi:hypothetical protein